MRNMKKKAINLSEKCFQITFRFFGQQEKNINFRTVNYTENLISCDVFCANAYFF